MKKHQKIIAFLLATLFVLTISIVSVFAWDYDNTKTGSFGNTSNYETTFKFTDNSELRAYGRAYNANSSYTLRIAISAGVSYLSGGTAGGSDDGYFRMGNPGLADVIVYLDDYCEWAFAEYNLYENGVYILTVGDSW